VEDVDASEVRAEGVQLIPIAAAPTVASRSVNVFILRVRKTNRRICNTGDLMPREIVLDNSDARQY
jgi:hypothetical protein